jgi:hypothetical protein
MLGLMLAAAPAAAARRAPPPPPLPPLELPMAAPIVEVDVLGQRLRLLVRMGEFGRIIVSPAAAARVDAARAAQPDPDVPQRGMIQAAVGQVRVKIPFTRETAVIAGRTRAVMMLRPAVAPTGIGNADGEIGLPLLPHPRVILRARPALATDRTSEIDGLFTTRSGAVGFYWPAIGRERLEVELHPDRAVSIASVAAASSLAQRLGGKLTGDVRRVEINHGVTRPVRSLQLAGPLRIAGTQLTALDVRLFDWAGRSELPPDSDEEQTLTVTGSRGRQRGWPILKLGADALGACASLAWDQPLARFTLVCPPN